MEQMCNEAERDSILEFNLGLVMPFDFLTRKVLEPQRRRKTQQNRTEDVIILLMPKESSGTIAKKNNTTRDYLSMRK